MTLDEFDTRGNPCPRGFDPVRYCEMKTRARFGVDGRYFKCRVCGFAGDGWAYVAGGPDDPLCGGSGRSTDYHRQPQPAQREGGAG
ncbi:MAG TPA: hypothetical protein VKQ30_21660 [Ktedonobacterales bacterium]|nr:hypothetical protein [Ktedonobacterales bacterium]